MPTLTLRGIPVIARFDVNDPWMRSVWAGMYGLVSLHPGGLSAARFISQLGALTYRGLKVTVTQTTEGIEVEALRR